MSLSKVNVFLHKKDPSNRLHVLALAIDTHTYFNVKISYPDEIVKLGKERNYKSLKNSFMIFKIDCSEAFKIAMEKKKFRQNSGSFKDYAFLWQISSKEVKDEYEKLFIGYKELLPKALNFVPCFPQERTTEAVAQDHIPTPHPEIIQNPSFGLSPYLSNTMGENENLFNLGYGHYDLSRITIQTPVPIINQLDWYGSSHDILNWPLVYTPNLDDDDYQIIQS
ncbi:9730_t:CDS:2 [Funneliformis caledonium]|uniref:9730_t:CDS:1 n=1 Tax=Funneliformis caledonium TaxID=1117310 RepID=A0A9N9BHA4_9GLOM|nr:9730_t:CDS:2 [Funneliformis caledonium]